LRCGPTPVPGFGAATGNADIDVIGALVYKMALTESQITAINEWLITSVGGSPPPAVNRFTATPGAVATGGSSTLIWEVGHADTTTITPAVGAVASTGTTTVSPATTTTYTLTAVGPGGETTAQLTVGVDVPVGDPLITELLATNNNTLEDADGDASDWLEVHNPNAFPLNIGGYYLTDDPVALTRWQIPSGITLPGGGYLVVFASGKNRAEAGAELHTSFSLNSGGEYLALVAPDGTTVVSEFAPAFPRQIPDTSYGIDETSNTRFLATPTPGEPNGPGFAGKVADTKFSVDRGFYTTPQSVAITTATPGAEIRYTTDGSEPAATSGTVYTAPVQVTTTTVLRAAAFKTDMIPTDVDTHSYLFLDHVIRQPRNPPGFPTRWGSRSVDYAMDQRVVDDPVYSTEIIAGLKSIRTLSIVVPQDEFFNRPRGIYANPGGEGRAWEREASFEFLHPDDPSEDVQTNTGIRIHGNGSRSAGGQPKHSFRVEFRGEYGAKRLRYRLFPDIPVDRFDSIILRGQNAHGWTRSSQISNSVGTSEREQSQYIRDSFARDIMKNMGQTSGESTYVHLYINGLYWGLYNPVEYPRTYYGVSHFGGVEDDYDVINRRTTTTKILDGTFEAWNAMQSLANSGLETREKYQEMQSHIDIDNLIDYMLMHQYMGSRDGPEVFNSNNMRSLRRTRGPTTTTWIAMPWDMEASMFEINVTRNVNVGSASQQANSLARVYSELRANPEFRLRYADHVQLHCFNGGALTPARTAATWEKRAAEIYTAILGESARWGDYRRSSRAFTRDAEWQQERDRLLTTYFPTRTEFLVNLLIRHRLFPQTDAPVFSQHGGSIAAGSSITITSDAGTAYLTLDGTDPREPWTSNRVGTAYDTPIVLGRSTTLKARTLDNGEWSALTEATFLVGTPASPENLAVSEIMYNPLGTSEALEFVELANTSDASVDLSGVTFGDGIDFSFPIGTTLAAGDHILIVADQTAFAAEHGPGLPVAGEFDNATSLDNDGETLTVLAADGSPIESSRFNDALPWPTSPDGLGPSLTRIRTTPSNDPTEPTSWRPSGFAGGSPGTTDTANFNGDPDADDNQNGLSNFVEHAVGSTLTAGTTETGGTLYPTLTFTQNLLADDASVTLETSTDFLTWIPGGTPTSTVHNGDATATVTWRSARPLDPIGRQTYLRLRIQQVAAP
ncbi:MAG: lamin tail domain-containing protein, partial [Verrucomicrobiales bacterium]|nr:lamin tail domain-containing protein [Verrucomicrobiales bacterium]